MKACGVSYLRHATRRVWVMGTCIAKDATEGSEKPHVPGRKP